MGPYQARISNVNGEARLLFVTIVGPVRVFQVSSDDDDDDDQQHHS